MFNANIFLAHTQDEVWFLICEFVRQLPSRKRPEGTIPSYNLEPLRRATWYGTLLVMSRNMTKNSLLIGNDLFE